MIDDEGVFNSNRSFYPNDVNMPLPTTPYKTRKDNISDPYESIESAPEQTKNGDSIPLSIDSSSIDIDEYLYNNNNSIESIGVKPKRQVEVEEKKKIFIEKESSSIGIYCILCRDNGSIEVYIYLFIYRFMKFQVILLYSPMFIFMIVLKS